MKITFLGFFLVINFSNTSAVELPPKSKTVTLSSQLNYVKENYRKLILTHSISHKKINLNSLPRNLQNWLEEKTSELNLVQNTIGQLKDYQTNSNGQFEVPVELMDQIISLVSNSVSEREEQLTNKEDQSTYSTEQSTSNQLLQNDPSAADHKNKIKSNTDNNSKRNIKKSQISNSLKYSKERKIRDSTSAKCPASNPNCVQNGRSKNKKNTFKHKHKHAHRSLSHCNYQAQHHKTHTHRLKDQLNNQSPKSIANPNRLPGLITTAGEASITYNAIFHPLLQNSTFPPPGIQETVYSLQVYDNLRNFAISFARHRSLIEKSLTEIKSNISLLQFDKTETLAYIGNLQLYNSLKVSPKALETPFQAQDQQLTIICNNFTNLIDSIDRDVDYAFAQNVVLDEATSELTGSDRNIVSPGNGNINYVDRIIRIVPGLLTVYGNIQFVMIDLQQQLSGLQIILTQIQSVLSNMQLIVMSKSSSVKAWGGALYSLYSLIVLSGIYVTQS